MKPKMPELSKNQRILIAAVIVLGLVGSVTYSSIPSNIQLSSWEAKDGLKSVIINGETFTETNLPAGGNYSWGGNYAKFDIDNAQIGFPTLSFQLGYPIEYINEGGDWVKARWGETYKQLEPKVIGQETYVFYHHVFFVELQIVAEADYFVWGTTCHGEARGMYEAEKPQISVRFVFDAGLWKVLSRIQGPNNESVYVNSGVWTGIMSASVFSATAAYVEPLPQGFAGLPGAWSVTNIGPVNMRTIDEKTQGITDPDTTQANPALISGIPSKLIIEVGGTSLEPGWWWPLFGSVGTYAVYANYRIRIDVLTSAKYTFYQGDQDDKLKKPLISANATDPLGDFLAWLESKLAALGLNLAGTGLFIIAVLVLLILYRRAGRRE